ncbi:MAG: ATP-dependent DNA helicase Rep, partial [Oxalobacteraceae bacterium]|nr:ATP-dependent DNA helicase Rep [Oxalobacteraceae bacterium]
MSTGLNPQQHAAVTHVEGPCLVLAGAGSGKTRVITAKIAHLIEHCGYAPKNIAALTFTNKAALEMRERVAKLLGEPALAKQLTVSTFHSLGVQILRREASSVGLKERFSIMDSDDCFAILQDLAASTDKAVIRRLQHQISLWKNALCSPDQALTQAQDEQQAQAARVYRSYVATLTSYQSVDFDDLIRLPVELFRANAEARDRWQRRLRYLDFPELKLIKLEQNYRSSNRILRAANAVIGNNPKVFDKSLWSEHGMGDQIQVIAMDDEESEANQVAVLLSAHKFDRRARYSDYAILYRGNHQSRVLEKALRRERIPYVMSGGQSFFDRAEIKDIVAYLRLIANGDDDPAFIRAVTTPRRGVGQATLEVLGEFSRQWNCSLFEAAYKGGLEARLSERQLNPLREFCDFIQQLEARAMRADQVSGGDHAGAVLDDMMKAIDYEQYLYNAFDDKQAQEKWQNVLDFTGWLKEKSRGGVQDIPEEKSLLELTQMVALMSMLEGRDEAPDAVRLSTLHAAKGLEFGHVFMVGVEEGILPHKGDPDAPPDSFAQRIEEERRLMYVGITRAQRSLTVTWCKQRKRARDNAACEPS